MSQPLNATDAALWDIERDPTLRTTIVAVLHLAEPVDADWLLNDLEAATRVIPKLRQRVVAGPAGIGTPHWETIQDFDITDHVHFVDLAEDLDAQVEALAAELAGGEIDRSGALWSCSYLGGEAGPAALVVQVHHSLTDGVGGFELLDAMLDDAPQTGPRSLDEIPPTAAPSRSAAAALAARTRRIVELQVDATTTMVAAAAHPLRTASALAGGVESTLRLLAPRSAPLSKLMVGRSAQRQVRTIDADLERLHDAAAKHGCTINQLLFAAVVGALTEYHRHSRRRLDRLRVLMPVSLRSSDAAAGGNQWGPVKVTVPATIADPLERMLTMRSILDSARREPALGFSQALAGAVQMLPSALSAGLVSGMMQGVDAVVTNVPGLREERFLCGSLLSRVYAFAPTGGAALNVALVSNRGTAHIGVLTDAAAIDAPDDLRALLDQALIDVVVAAEEADPTAVPDAVVATVDRRSSDRLSALDTAFLRLESDDTPMHLGGVLTMRGPALRDASGAIRIDVVRRHVQARLARVPQFRRELAEVPLGLGRPVWVDDGDFDITRHVRLTSVPRPGGLQQLFDLAARLHENRLDRNHPLWELWVVDGLADGSVGLVEKVHHALVDGVGGVELLAALFDPEPSAEPDLPVHLPTRRAPGPLRRLGTSAFDRATDPLRLARSTAELLLRSPERLVEQARSVGAAASELLRPAAVAPHASFNRRVERQRTLRRVTVGLADVQRVQGRHQATVNDVVLAAIAGALGSWLTQRGEVPFDTHALVPVSVRKAGLAREPGNRVGAVVAGLPVTEPDPDRRVRRIRDQMGRHKQAHEGEGVAMVFDAFDHLPARSLQAARLLAVQRFVNLVVTNVPGPSSTLYFLDAEVDEMVPILPLGPNLGLGIAVLSYRDRLTISLFADPVLVDDLDVLADAVTDEFASLDEGPKP